MRASIGVTGRELARLGGWMTISNLAWPLLMYVDRFLVASVLSVAAAGYYATPSDMLGRFSLVTVAVMQTAFPAMAAAFRTDPDHAATLLRRCGLAVASVLFLPALIVTAFSHEILTLWMGASFAQGASGVMRWLALAVVLGGADTVIAGFIDSIGRPDVNAKFSLAELALYVPILALLLEHYGIEGAAWAWTLRVGLDLVVRSAIATRLVPSLQPVLARILAVTVVATLALALPMVAGPIADRLAFMGLACAIYGVVLWTWGVDMGEKAYCFRRLAFRAAVVTR